MSTTLLSLSESRSDSKRHIQQTFSKKSGLLHSKRNQPALVVWEGCTAIKKVWYVHGKKHRENDNPACVYDNGAMKWYFQGKLHRCREGKPAVVLGNNTKIWYEFGVKHRSKGPAVIRFDGAREWWKHGVRHRGRDKPAVIYNDTKEWWKHGVRHRDDDLPAVTDFEENHKEWWNHGVRHRENGPAVLQITEYGEYCEWWLNGLYHRSNGEPAIYGGETDTHEWYEYGQRHRIGGPAVSTLMSDGSSYEEYWVRGIRYSLEKYKKKFG